MRPKTELIKYVMRFTFIVFIAIALMGLICCTDIKSGEELAKAGFAAGNTLASYFDSLAQDVVDIWEMEAFIDSIRGISFTEEAQKMLQEQINALQHRAQLARSLADTYKALQDLSSYDASGEVKIATETLTKEVQEMPMLPKSNVDPSSILGSVAGDIAAWQQARDIKEGSKLILDLLRKFKQLYDSETEAYKSINLERGNKVSVVVEYLLKKKMVLGIPLLQKVPESLGLPWASSNKPFEDEKSINATIELAKVRIQRMAFLSSDAADGLAKSISLLIENQQNFLKKSGLSLSEMSAALQKTQSYIDEISKLRSQKNK
jgi:hypothetical protein